MSNIILYSGFYLFDTLYVAYFLKKLVLSH